VVGDMNVIIKREIQDRYNAKLPGKHHCSFVHSADNEEEAVEYTQIFFGDEADQILEKIRRLRGQYNALATASHRTAPEGSDG